MFVIAAHHRHISFLINLKSLIDAASSEFVETCVARLSKHLLDAAQFPVPLQDLEEETSKGADAVATKAIIQCVSSDSRFFLLGSIPFCQIDELKAAETLGTDLPRRSLFVSFIALAFTAMIEVPKPDQVVVDSLLDTRHLGFGDPRRGIVLRVRARIGARSRPIRRLKSGNEQ
ncbi:BQ5605_C050g12504 [Microbotryum silenes-dioicae]|uniref:BQ5605_C050g12504 protein n=1 Tax=Microbotryum silenes-dioicae TaxID=796604 RepID=A0A2X0NAJ3_9BASI|nr:BQ5605_C050g12504 [Microbotryum silenes-dioicae]